jgi:hypothetical protein
MSSLPQFTEDGLLPAGDYPLSFTELYDSLLVHGPGDLTHPNWDAGWRLELVKNLEILVRQLWQVGIQEIFIDGSFVEDKDHPNDIDGYFVCELQDLTSGQLEARLNALDPYQIWTWDPSLREPYRGYAKLQLPMWHRYRVEFYPHFGFGPLSGIQDQFGNNLLFPSAFRLSRRGEIQHGIVKIIGETA